MNIYFMYRYLRYYPIIILYLTDYTALSRFVIRMFVKIHYFC